MADSQYSRSPTPDPSLISRYCVLSLLDVEHTTQTHTIATTFVSPRYTMYPHIPRRALNAFLPGAASRWVMASSLALLPLLVEDQENDNATQCKIYNIYTEMKLRTLSVKGCPYKIPCSSKLHYIWTSRPSGCSRSCCRRKYASMNLCYSISSIIYITSCKPLPNAI